MEEFKIGDKFINKGNSTIATIIKIEKDRIVVAQTVKSEKSYDLELNNEWIRYLISNKTWEQIKGEL